MLVRIVTSLGEYSNARKKNFKANSGSKDNKDCSPCSSKTALYKFPLLRV